MNKLVALILFMLALLSGQAQSQKQPVKKAKITKAKGYLKNLTGLESCGWVIELDKKGQKKLEPINLDTFKLNLIEGKVVEFTYKPSNSNSTCMAGKLIELVSIKYK